MNKHERHFVVVARYSNGDKLRLSDLGFLMGTEQHLFTRLQAIRIVHEASNVAAFKGCTVYMRRAYQEEL